MRFRPASLLAAAALVVAVAVGCTPSPAPTATPTGFATEDEAYAAAEGTYRAYVDALNQVDLSDPKTFEAVFALTTGEANAADRESFSRMHAEGLTVSGLTKAPLIAPLPDSSTMELVELAVCLDVSDVELTNSGGSASSPDRPDVQSLLVQLKPSPTSETGLLISRFSNREGDPTCRG